MDVRLISEDKRRIVSADVMCVCSVQARLLLDLFVKEPGQSSRNMSTEKQLS